MSRQITRISAILVLVSGLMASAAMAQKEDRSGIAPVGMFTGKETVPGTLDDAGSMRYGNSFVLTSFGEWEAHHLTVSVDYSNDSFNPNNLMITGGSWSLVVFRDHRYAGTLFGKVQSGVVNLVTDGKGRVVSKRIQAILNATGGLGIIGEKGHEGINGVYNMETDLRSNATSGNASFNL